MWWGWSLILPLQKGALRLPSRRRDLFSPWKREYWNSRRLRRLRRGGISLNPPPSPTRAPPSRLAEAPAKRVGKPARRLAGGEELKTPVPEQVPPLFLCPQ